MTERRALRVEVRAPEDTPGKFEAIVVRYGVVDTYGTRFRAGCFTESLEERLPRICWGHDWTEPIGRYVDYRDNVDSLTLMGELDDFDAVPRARQCHAQLRSGTIDQFSIGFVRKADEHRSDAMDITRAELEEASPVIIASVPGTKLVSVRSAGGGAGMVTEDLLAGLARKVSRGELSQHEAEVALALAAGETPAGKKEPVEDPPDPDELIAQILGDDPEMLDTIERWS